MIDDVLAGVLEKPYPPWAENSVQAGRERIVAEAHVFVDPENPVLLNRMSPTDPGGPHRVGNTASESKRAEKATTWMQRSSPTNEGSAAGGDSATTRLKAAEASVHPLLGLKPGRKPNADFNRTVARIMESSSPNWRDHLPDICEALDREQQPLTRSNKWRALGCKDWQDVHDADREGLIKALRHRLNWVSRHSTPERNQHRG